METTPVLPPYNFYSFYIYPVFSWLRILTARFFKGIVDGILYTPLIELIFGGIRSMKKA